MKMINKLLNTVETLSSQVKGYEKRFDELSAKIGVKSPPVQSGDGIPTQLNLFSVHPHNKTLKKLTKLLARVPVRAIHKPLQPWVHHHLQKHQNYKALVMIRGNVALTQLVTAQC